MATTKPGIQVVLSNMQCNALQHYRSAFTSTRPSALTALTLSLILFFSSTNTSSMLSSLNHLVTQPGHRTHGKEGDMRLQASWHVLVDAHAVLPHAMVADCRAQHGVPGPVPQQQIIPPDVDHSWHMLVPVPGQHGCVSLDVTHLWHMLVPVGVHKQACAHDCRMTVGFPVMVRP